MQTRATPESLRRSAHIATQCISAPFGIFALPLSLRIGLKLTTISTGVNAVKCNAKINTRRSTFYIQKAYIEDRHLLQKRYTRRGQI